MEAWYSFTVQFVYQNCNLVCMYYQLYEHVHAYLHVIVLPLFIDPTRNFKQPAAQLSVVRALSADILRPLFESRCNRLIHNVFFIRRMSES